VLRERLLRWKGFIKALLWTVFLVFILKLGFESWHLTGGDMAPTVYDNDRLLGEKISYWFRAPRRHEIVMYRNPLVPNRTWTGRIIGLPGERVEISNGVVRINGEVLEEPYRDEPTPYDYETTVPEECYFVLCDRRQNIYFSAVWGSVPRSAITDRVAWRFWPWRRIGFLGP
jgi:signal peptidase I